MSQVFRIAIVLVVVCVFSASASAQDSGARVAGSFAGAFGEGETNIAAGGSVGYRFTSHIGFELEAIALPDLKLDDTRADGRGVAFLTNFVAEFPSPVRWLMPYFQGGGGIANLSQSQSRYRMLEGEAGSVEGSDPVFFGARRDPRGPMMGRIDSRRDPRTNMPVVDFGQFEVPGRSETGVALSVGGGVDFTVWHGLALGPTISYLKVFGNVTDRDLTRVGLRTSYRF